MSKKFLPILIFTALLLFMASVAFPGEAAASKLLGITVTPTPTSETPTNTPSVTITEETPTDTPTPATISPTPTGTLEADTPTPTRETTPRTPRPPKETEVVLLPATGEFPIDLSQGMQLFFGLVLILSIGFVLIRTLRGQKIKK